MYIYQGAVVMQKVRDRFKAGHKSNNKLYHVDVDGAEEPGLDLRFSKAELLKFAMRSFNAGQSNSYRTPLVPTRHEDALAILKLPRGHCSGNCDEMSSLSAYYAEQDYHVDKDRLYIAELSKPADHVFCVITDGKPVTQATFATVLDFTRDGRAKDWLIIDPWLHVCCRGKDYLTKGGEKLEKWGSVGKRVSWTHPTQGWGWYPPNGDYKTRFAEGGVKLVGFHFKRF